LHDYHKSSVVERPVFEIMIAHVQKCGCLKSDITVSVDKIAISAGKVRELKNYRKERFSRFASPHVITINCRYNSQAIRTYDRYYDLDKTPVSSYHS